METGIILANEKDLAGNTFTLPTCCSYHSYDIDNTNGNPITYNHHLANQNNDPRVKPELRSSNVFAQEWGVSFNSSTSCPSSIMSSFDDVTTSLNYLCEAKSKFDSLTDLLTILTDGGNTDSLTLAIFFSVPTEAWNLYIDLLSKSPYLSDTVLKSSVLREAVLIDAMIRDILVANPQSAKSDSIIQLLEDRIPPLSDTMMTEIMDGKNILGAKELLEINRANWYQQYSDTYNDIMNIYLTDTVHDGLNDSITSLMEKDFRLGTKYSLTFRLLEKGEVVQADNAISSIPLNFTLNSYETEEYQRYYSYFGCMKRALQNSVAITFDSVQTARLDSLVSTDTNFLYVPTVLAKNALQIAGLITYNEKVTFDSASVPLKSVHGPYFKKYPKNYFHVYPNPATNYIIADYKTDQGADKKIVISNLNGNLIKIFPIRRGEDQKVIPITDLENGAYLLTLFSNNQPLSSSKIIVNK